MIKDIKERTADLSQRVVELEIELATLKASVFNYDDGDVERVGRAIHGQLIGSGEWDEVRCPDIFYPMARAALDAYLNPEN
jgi:hypothetical protein